MLGSQSSPRAPIDAAVAALAAAFVAAVVRVVVSVVALFAFVLLHGAVAAVRAEADAARSAGAGVPADRIPRPRRCGGCRSVRRDSGRRNRHPGRLFPSSHSSSPLVTPSPHAGRPWLDVALVVAAVARFAVSVVTFFVAVVACRLRSTAPHRRRRRRRPLLRSPARFAQGGASPSASSPHAKNEPAT